MTSEPTVLIVDDEKHNRQLLTELLQDEARLTLAKSGAQALERARAWQPDLILLDVMMEGMDGHAVMRSLKEDQRTCNIPVIFITALDSLHDQEIGFELGAADYISKPFHPPVVRARVRNHLRLVEQRRQLEELALLDNLTGIPNRHRYIDTIEQEWRRCLRHQLPLSLAIVDIDHFKLLNDRHGHAEGDHALRSVAQTLQQALKRPGDFVCRYGGEEFVLLLPGVDGSGARQFADILRQRIAALPLQTANGENLQVTVSIGGVSRVPHSGLDCRKLFAAADEALYAAKRSGRNCVQWAD